MIEGSSYSCVCLPYEREKNIGEEREQVRIGQKRVAEIIKEASDKKFKAVAVGDSVALNVPKVDRAPFDSRNLLGRILHMKDNFTKLGPNMIF